MLVAIIIVPKQMGDSSKLLDLVIKCGTIGWQAEERIRCAIRPSRLIIASIWLEGNSSHYSTMIFNSNSAL